MVISLIAQPAAGKDGLDLPEEALALFIDLDLEGRVLVQMPDGRLRVGMKIGANPPELSSEQRAKISQYKAHLLALVVYCHEDH